MRMRRTAGLLFAARILRHESSHDSLLVLAGVIGVFLLVGLAGLALAA